MSTRSLWFVRGSMSRGQTLAEFAIVLPVLLLAFMGIYDLARVAYTFNAVADAARNGVREAIVNQTCADVFERAKSAAPAVDLSMSDSIEVTIYRSAVVSNTPTPETCAGGLLGGYGIGYLAEVRVRTTFTAITPIISQIIGAIPITSAARLPIERAHP